jgi:phosphoglycolate phosphatase
MKHFIFDFDGVIADSLSIALEEINKLRSSDYCALPSVNSQEDMALLYPGPLKTSLRRFGFSDSESKSFFDRHSKAMASRAHEIRPFNHVVSAICSLVPNDYSIVTSAYSSAVRVVLDSSPHFTGIEDECIIGRERNLSKTDKIEQILKCRRLQRSDVLHFGDMVSDLLYSRDARVAFCAVGWGYHPINYIRAFGPDYTASNTDEFITYLRL